ncbi:disintegrin and metalloproteinase domain-containing protein 30 [Sturnira hondurensis]|uniref:disintegrin and metalloproteinase domain-containing protein 30 n=1 Tax=Sturnira hondurensis TaxID=192404 RepID=UPI001879B412|nr:disintegrin and metalloproteinase domain-containing protein 30 [Sturnira hondurensis]
MRPVRTVLSRGHLLLMLGLVVLLVDTYGEDLIFHPEWGFDSYEITIPKKLSFRGGEQAVANHVSYLLQVKGRRHVLHLWPKRFLLPRHLPVLSHTKEGELLEDFPYIPRDCNYVGLVEGVEGSEATLSTCTGGLRGVLKIDAKHYQIQPLKASSTFEHVVYLLKNEEGFQGQICGVTGEEIEKRMSPPEDVVRISDFSGSVKHQKYLDLVMVFDYARYRYVQYNSSRIVYDAILLTGIIDTYYQEIRVRIQLKGVDIWSLGNKVSLTYDELATALSQFLKYSYTLLNKKIQADWAHIYIRKNYTDGLAWSRGRLCELEVGSASVIPDVNLLLPATWTTHELGHGLGMTHDAEYCLCKGKRTCIMGNGRTGFSNCSYNSFLNFVRQKAKCLTDIPGVGYVVKRCGNKIVEDKEECDCGSKEDCKKDHCCQPDCTLKPGANCSTGLCCHNCRFRPSGYVCRKEENECDLAEYCNGASGVCPTDMYKQDGTPCKYEARCFRKGCRSTYMQCQSIFGPDAREAPIQCYEAVNLIGDQYGNCGILEVSQYQKCTKQNSLCGRVQCINVQTLPDRPDHTNIISTHLHDENLMCWGTGYHLSMRPMGIPDTGAIIDGTSCGKNQICWNRTCVDSSVLNFDCLPEKCNHRGFCNNRKNCHCRYGWAPPFCEDAGFGGSQDSGPPGMLKMEVPDSVQVSFLMLLRLVLFAFSVIFVVFRQSIISCLRPKQKNPTNTGNK